MVHLHYLPPQICILVHNYISTYLGIGLGLGLAAITWLGQGCSTALYFYLAWLTSIYSAYAVYGVLISRSQTTELRHSWDDQVQSFAYLLLRSKEANQSGAAISTSIIGHSQIHVFKVLIVFHSSYPNVTRLTEPVLPFPSSFPFTQSLDLGQSKAPGFCLYSFRWRRQPVPKGNVIPTPILSRFRHNSSSSTKHWFHGLNP